MGKLTDGFSGSSQPIGVAGVQAYVDEMNARHGGDVYVWFVDEMTTADGVVLKSVGRRSARSKPFVPWKPTAAERALMRPSLKLIEGGE